MSTLRILLISLALGIAMFLLAFFVSWHSAGSGFYTTDIFQLETIGQQRDFFYGVYSYTEGNGILPSSLEDVNAFRIEKAKADAAADGYPDINVASFFFPVDKNDKWNNPYIITYSPTTVTITSYGRDGKPGGTWLDRDIVNGKLIYGPGESKANDKVDWDTQSYKLSERPTLFTFYFKYPTDQIWLLNILCGIGTFLVSLMTLLGRKKGTVALSSTILHFFAIIFFTLLFSAIAATAHIPSGH